MFMPPKTKTRLTRSHSKSTMGKIDVPNRYSSVKHVLSFTMEASFRFFQRHFLQLKTLIIMFLYIVSFLTSGSYQITPMFYASSLNAWWWTRFHGTTSAPVTDVESEVPAPWFLTLILYHWHDSKSKLQILSFSGTGVGSINWSW